MSDAGVSWAWYAGGWDNAAGEVGGPGWTNGTTQGTCTDPNVSTADRQYPYCPDSSFQFHHQPFNYFTRYAPGTTDRAAAPEGRGRVHRRRPGTGLCRR